MHRLIARLDVKGANVIKGIHLEGLRIVGEPRSLAQKYDQEGIDEILFIDSVASLYRRNNLVDVVKNTAPVISVPMTVGGGIRSIEDIRCLLSSGADKVAINTYAINNPDFISSAAAEFGSQSIVVSIQAKRASSGGWVAYTDNARENTGKDVLEWAVECEKRGAGEILITSVDQEGLCDGPDYDLISSVADLVRIPILVSGGIGDATHIDKLFHVSGVAGAVLASILHYEKTSVTYLRSHIKNGHRIRRIVESKNDINISEKQVVLLDLGISNIASLQNMCSKLTTQCQVVRELVPEDCSRLLIPGVGTFPAAMRAMGDRNAGAIRELASGGIPIMGICLGAQILFDRGEEDGGANGLGILPGSVKSLRANSGLKGRFMLPHIGWEQVEFRQHPLLGSMDSTVDMYFAHSYTFVPDEEEAAVGSTTYFESSFCSFAMSRNIFACQFHPEKSGTQGQELLANFLQFPRG